ncbi:MAG: hypothetical protein ACP5HZ_01460 [Ferrimicrobium sp.]|uniref:hypothetical protein n=1 Tax=Ferrimicrobium sp. TaxID=2926050 RepID=UPI002617B86B|nr:hypothetical protein [Ferrimicrobium sp.]
MNPYVEAGYAAVTCSLGGYALYLGMQSRQVRLRLAQLKASELHASPPLEDVE